MKKSFLVVLVLVMGLVAGVLLLGKNADLRRSADASTASVYFIDPSGSRLAEIGATVDQATTLQLMIDTLNVPINSADIKFTFDSSKLQVVSITKTSAFQTEVRNTIGNGVARLNLVQGPPNLPTGIIHVADLVVKPLVLPVSLNFSSETMLTQFNVPTPLSASLINITFIDQKKNTTPPASNKDFSFGLFAGPISKVGNSLSFKLMAQVPSEARFDSYALDLNLDPSGPWVFDTAMGGSDINNLLFDPTFRRNSEKSVSLYGLRKPSNSNLPTGNVELAVIKLVNPSGTVGNIGISFANDEITAWKGILYEQRATVSLANSTLNLNVGSDSVPSAGSFQFKLSFSGLMDYSTSSCAKPQTVDVTIKGSGVEKEYKKVAIVKTGNYCRVWNSESKDKCDLYNAVYTGSVDISTLGGSLENAAVLVRGPLGVTTKFGEDGQIAYYNALVGKLRIVPGAVFDFSKYALVPGDTNGDDIVNGQDYVELVRNLGSNNLTNFDMDFNCTVNAQDLNLLKLALSERQAQKY